MKISFIAENDWANVLTEYSYCLNKHSEDLESKSICLKKHPFNYNIQHDYDLSVCSLEQLKEARQFLEDSDVIVFGEEGAMQPTNFKVLEIYKHVLKIDLFNSNKKLIIWHPGSHYRNNPSFYNNHPLRSRIHKHLYAMDLYRLSPQSENDMPLHTYQYYDFSYDTYINNFQSKLNFPRTILHIPSISSVKGTSLINKCISECNLDKKKFIYKTLHNIPHSEVIKEKEQSIFYVDQLNSLGGYGVAAIEALYNSNLTFSTSCNIAPSLFKITGKYDSPVINLDENPTNIIKTLNKFFNMGDEELTNLMKKIGKWFEEQYNPNLIVKFFNKRIL